MDNYLTSGTTAQTFQNLTPVLSGLTVTQTTSLTTALSGSKVTQTANVTFVPHASSAQPLAPLTLLSKDILCEKLFNKITKFCQEDKFINPDYFILNFASIASFFSTNRVKLQVGKNRPTDANTFIVFVGYSGKGKTYMNDFFQDSINEIQSVLVNEGKKFNDFVKACKAYNFSNTDITEEQKDGYVQGYKKSHFTNFDQFLTKEIKPQLFTPLEYTPEALSDRFNSSRNGALLLNATEFQELKTNIGRTKTVEDIFTFLIPYHEGRSGTIIRKTQDDVIIEKAKLCVLINTPPNTFEELRLTNFFPSAAGYRFFFYFDNVVDLSDPHLAEKSDDCMSFYERYQAEVKNIIETYVFNMIYNSIGQCKTLIINDDHTLKIYNELLLSLWNDHVKYADCLLDHQKETFKSRLATMLNKSIMNTYMMNHSHDDNLSFSFDTVDLTETEIRRGYNYYRFFLPQTINIFDTELKSDLTNKQIKIIELMNVGKVYDTDILLKMVTDNKIAGDATFYRMLQKKSKQFTVILDRVHNKQRIIRNF